MPGKSKEILHKRQNCIPILHVIGSHYSVGVSIGRTFKSMITELLAEWEYFNDILWKSFCSPEGKETFEKCLNHCRERYPQYVDEIRGMADGSGIKFDKLFLLNIDTIISKDECELKSALSGITGETGCTSIMCNQNEVILGHTEDAMCEILNNVYIISAEIVDDDGKRLEKFTTFSYAGHLMGYTMGYNEHGMVHSVNTLFPVVNKSGTPRAFIARALLGSRNLYEVLDILRDSGSGIADGFSLNVCFANTKNDDENYNGSRISCYNIEVLPPPPSISSCGNGSGNVSPVMESELSVLTVESGKSYIHCNKYLRMETTEESSPKEISTCRHRTAANKFSEPKSLPDVKMILSDQSDENFPIFICDEIVTKMPHIKTVAVGIFDILGKTWSIYMDKPAESDPVAVLQMKF